MNKCLIFCWLSFVLFFGGCTEDKVFDYQLSDEKLVEILSDIHISESATQHLSLSFRDSMSKVYLSQVLEIHGVSQEVFEPDYLALKRDPQKLAIVYDKIIKKLNEIKSKRKKGKKPKGQGSKQRTKKK